MLLIYHIGKEETKNSRLPAHSPGVCGLGQSHNLGTQSSCLTQVARTRDLEPSSATPGIRSRTRVLQVGCLRPEWTVNWCTQCLSHNSRTTSLPFLCVALRGSLPEPPAGPLVGSIQPLVAQDRGVPQRCSHPRLRGLGACLHCGFFIRFGQDAVFCLESSVCSARLLCSVAVAL